MTTVWFYVLVCLSGPTCPQGTFNLAPSGGYDREAYYSQEQCEIHARLIAKAMHVKDGSEWGYYCKADDYEPKKVQPK